MARLANLRQRGCAVQQQQQLHKQQPHKQQQQQQTHKQQHIRWRLLLGAFLLRALATPAEAAVRFDPCDAITPITRVRASELCWWPTRQQ